MKIVWNRKIFVLTIVWQYAIVWLTSNLTTQSNRRRRRSDCFIWICAIKQRTAVNCFLKKCVFVCVCVCLWANLCVMYSNARAILFFFWFFNHWISMQSMSVRASVRLSLSANLCSRVHMFSWRVHLIDTQTCYVWPVIFALIPLNKLNAEKINASNK